ncbi:MAG TPA: hypothetical protein VNR00_02445 [Opitutus sp.]|nr:hypothetical protein [Opitutus sp.]
MNYDSVRRLWTCSLLAACVAVSLPAALVAGQIRLAPPEASIGARTGASVSLDGNTLALGSPDDDAAGPFAGAVFVFVRDGASWRQQARLLGPATTGQRSFGESVAVNRDTLVVGAPFDEVTGDASGAAYVYVRQGETWVQQAKLVPADRTADQLFGDCVAIHGDTIVVGAFLDSGRAPNAGAAYVFTRSGSAWTQKDKLTASDASEHAFFGSAVAIRNGTIVIGSPVSETAYIFKYSNWHWRQQARLAPADAVPGDYSGFGAAVTVDQDTIAIGAPAQSGADLETGAVYLYQWDGSRWAARAKVAASDAAAGDEFGTSVSLEGHVLAVGAPYCGASNEGAIYTFQRRTSGWSLKARHVAQTTEFSAFLGASVCLCNGETVAGAPGFVEYAGRKTAGAAYLDPIW